MKNETNIRRRNNVIQDNFTESQKRRITLILPRDDLLIKGKIYKTAYDSMIYDEKEFLNRINEIKYLGSFDRICDIPKFTLLPNSKFTRIWDSLLFIFCLFTVIVLPLELGFLALDRINGANLIFYLTFEYFISCCLYVDIIFNFRRAVPTNKGKMILDSKEISLKYLKGLFIIDFISALPLDLLLRKVNFRSIFLRILIKIPRFLRIFRVLFYLNSFQNSKFLKICKLFFIYYLIAHYFSSAIFYTDAFSESNYYLNADILKSVLANSFLTIDYMQYTLNSIYVLCGNDNKPKDFTQRVLFTVMFYVGTMCDAVIFSNMAIFFAKLQSLEKEKNRKSDDLFIFLKTLGVNSVVKKEILDYHETLWWKNREKFLNTNFIRELNKFLKTRIKILQLAENYLDLCPFISSVSKQFLLKFCAKLKLLITHPNDIIIFEGSVDRKVYFISKKGKFSVKINGNIVKILYEGDLFGEISCFLKSHVRIATITSVYVSSVYYLEEKVTDEIFYDFPNEGKYFFKIAYNRFNESLKYMSDDLKKKIWSYKRLEAESDSIWNDDIIEMLKNQKMMA